MKLRDLLAGLEPLGSTAAQDLDVLGICTDSRLAQPGELFFCLDGSSRDGHAFLRMARRQGACAAVGAREGGEDDLPYVRVADTRLALAVASHRLHSEPTRTLRLAGVTGTCGKTTTVFALESILAAAGIETGRLGTLGHRYGGKEVEAPSTCPQAHDLARLLREMADAGVRAVAMEVTSHALAQRRTDGCRFEAVGFTNLGRDHLDFHSGMHAYLAAKRRLFTEYEVTAGAALNLDDDVGARLRREISLPSVGYGLRPGADVTASGVRLGYDGIRASIETLAGSFPLESGLVGRFNLLNLLAATSLALLMRVPLDAIALGLHRTRLVPGRLQDVGRPFGRRVLVDYAHNADALATVLAAVRPFSSGRLICVFGCGGDRDRGKRPLMGRAAAEGADVVLITSDNSRSETTADIMAAIVSGIDRERCRPVPIESPALAQERGIYALVEDRRSAIRAAVQAAWPEDTVLLCGKGHESYQMMGKRKLDFDDRQEALAALREVSGPRAPVHER